MFIAVDGIDGAGKTTLVHQLASHLLHLDPLITKEPTNDSPWAARIRDSALRERLSVEEELDIFHKDRMFHLETTIIPAIRAGRVVICDRYVDSTLAFQAKDEADADRLYLRFCDEILIPDITFILDCPVLTGLERIKTGRNRFTTFEKLDTLEKAQRIYRSRNGPNYVHVFAGGTPEATFESVVNRLNHRFPQIDADRPGKDPSDRSNPARIA
jgi:dTMP kinase